MRGGKRPGSGRKKKSDKKIPYSVKLRPDQKEFLKDHPKPAAQLIEWAIDLLMKLLGFKAHF